MVDYYEKEIECFDDKGTKRALWVKKNPISMRLITIMQAKWSNRKLCILFVVQVSKNKENDTEIKDEEAKLLQKYPVLQQYVDGFLVEVL